MSKGRLFSLVVGIVSSPFFAGAQTTYTYPGIGISMDIRGTREMIQIDQNDNGREVRLAVGEQVELSLAENRTTGYRWELKSQAEPVCELVRDRFDPPTGKSGNGGIHRWEFQAVKPGSGEILLEYRRPWEKNAGAAKTFKASVRIRD